MNRYLAGLCGDLVLIIRSRRSIRRAALFPAVNDDFRLCAVRRGKVFIIPGAVQCLVRHWELIYLTCRDRLYVVYDDLGIAVLVGALFIDEIIIRIVCIDDIAFIIRYRRSVIIIHRDFRNVGGFRHGQLDGVAVLFLVTASAGFVLPFQAQDVSRDMYLDKALFYQICIIITDALTRERKVNCINKLMT